jgi:hypothetical protein
MTISGMPQQEPKGRIPASDHDVEVRPRKFVFRVLGEVLEHMVEVHNAADFDQESNLARCIELRNPSLCALEFLIGELHQPFGDPMRSIHGCLPEA